MAVILYFLTDIIFDSRQWDHFLLFDRGFSFIVGKNIAQQVIIASLHIQAFFLVHENVI